MLTFRTSSADATAIPTSESTRALGDAAYSLSPAATTGGVHDWAYPVQRERGNSFVGSLAGRRRSHSITFPVGFASLVANPIGSIEDFAADGTESYRDVTVLEEGSAAVGPVPRFSITHAMHEVFAPFAASVRDSRLSTIADEASSQDEAGW